MERVRYGRVDNTRLPKNTLVTIRRDDMIYFGISRCRLDADRFTKEDGKRLAKQRADIAASGVAGAWTIDGSFYVHKSEVFGQVAVEDISKLLDYFQNIDEISYQNAKSN